MLLLVLVYSDSASHYSYEAWHVLHTPAVTTCELPLSGVVKLIQSSIEREAIDLHDLHELDHSISTISTKAGFKDEGGRQPPPDGRVTMGYITRLTLGWHLSMLSCRASELLS